MNNKNDKDDKTNKPIDIYEKLNAFRPLSSQAKKHPCKDCFNCLFCNETRCLVCLRNKSKKSE